MRDKEAENKKERRILAEFIVRHFSSKFSENISCKSILSHIRTPELSAIDKVIETLEEMIKYLRGLKNKIP